MVVAVGVNTIAVHGLVVEQRGDVCEYGSLLIFHVAAHLGGILIKETDYEQRHTVSAHGYAVEQLAPYGREQIVEEIYMALLEPVHE